MALAKLYQYEVCPFCWKVRVALALKKKEFEKIEVHPLNKKEISFSEYKKVPIYIDTKGQQVNDSNLIMKHIDAEFSSSPKLVADPGSDAAALQDKWLDWSETYVKAVPPLIYNTLSNALKAFDYITKLGNFSTFQKMSIKYSGALVMKMVAKKSKERQNIEDSAKHMETKMQEWVAALDGQPFRGGLMPDITDASVFGITLSMKGLPAYNLTEKNPDFYAWMRRMSEQSHISLNS